MDPAAASNVEGWVALLIQVPLVGVFIWYSLKMNDRQAKAQEAFMTALDKRDEAFEKRNLAVLATIKELNAAICSEIGKLAESQNEHDKYVRENVSKRPGGK